MSLSPRRSFVCCIYFTRRGPRRFVVHCSDLTHTLGSCVSQERAESAAKAKGDAKAIAVLKGAVHDLTLEVAGLKERAYSEATRTTARTRKTART